MFVGYFYLTSDGTDFSGIKSPLNSEESVKSKMKDLSKQVAEEQINSYEIAKRSGNDIDASVQAGIVAAAYLQAQDEINYNKWKQIEAAHQKAAGM